jgi:uncharacterized protein
MQTVIEALNALAIVDAELTAYQAEQAVARGGLAKLDEKLASLAQAASTSEAAANGHGQTIRSLQQDVRSTAMQIDQSRGKVGKARNEREANAVSRELEELRRILKDKERDLESVAMLAKTAEDELAAFQLEIETVKKERDEQDAASAARLTELEGLVASARERRDACSKTLPPATFRKYEQIRARRGSAVATTTDGTCSACHIALAPMVFSKLRQGGILDNCASCNRFISYRPKVVAVVEGSAP